MKKKTFRHECKMSFGQGGGNRKTNKRISSKNNKSDKEQVKEIYIKYYKNQVAALYNAVKGY